MKKLYTCFILFTLLISAERSTAQNDFGHAKMDSLSHILSGSKTVKDSILLLQKMIDITPINAGEAANYPDYFKVLLNLNERTKVLDSRPYQLLSDGNQYWAKKQYRQALNTMQAAVEEFDKQHKAIYPLLLNMRVLFGFLNDQENRIRYYQQRLEYYQVNGPVINTAACYHAIGGYYLFKGAFNQAINNYLKGAEIIRHYDPHAYVAIMGVVGTTYSQWGNVKKGLYYLSNIIAPAKALNDTAIISYNLFWYSNILFKDKQYEKALDNINEAIRFDGNTLKNGLRRVGYATFKAEIYLKLGQYEMALPLLKAAAALSDSGGYKTVSNFGYIEIDYDFYQYYLKAGDMEKAERSLLKAYRAAVDQNGVLLQLKYLRELGYFYKKQDEAELSAKYFDLYFKTYDDYEFTLEDFKVAQYEVDLNDKQQRDHINQLKQEKAIQDYQISRRNVLLWGSLAIVLMISGLLIFIYRQYRGNKKTLISLRKTQRQLIQSEKMASLGELTAGVAHEIQNPLNFVNNFADVSIELLDEMEAELKLGQTADAIDIAGDVKQNLEKIRHHGDRADSIVKGMLQHSRASSGTKEATDINVLADEYFRLAYHGLRAKDKSFNADLVTNFVAGLPKVDVIPQDIGRVLLNLFTNAFYAVNQKQKTADFNYKPTVELATSVNDGQIEIRVKDNGIGIPEHIRDKIMQPFFTTKPTGEGTGLGLSLSHDIVVKGHGGKIDVNTRENEFTEFTVSLPIN